MQESKIINENSKQFLKAYFKYFCNVVLKDEEEWFNSLYEWVKFFDELKKELKNKNNEEKYLKEKFIHFQKINKNSDEEIDKKIINILFNTQNSIGHISLGAGLVDENQSEQIIGKIIEILKKDDITDNEFSDFIGDIAKENKTPHAAAHRFLRAVFPDKLTALDPKDKHLGILNKLAKIGGINDSLDINKKIEFEKALMQSIKCEDFKDSCKKFIEEKCKGNKNCEELACNVIKQMFFWKLTEMFDNEIISSKAIVYYGAPGTGKTYNAKKEAKKIIESWKLRTFSDDAKEMIKVVQFHPSFSYEDFIEGIRPSKNGNFEVKDGVFRDFCKKAGEIEIKLWQNENFRNKFEDKDFCEVTLKEVKETIGEESFKEIFDDINYEKLKDLTLDEIIEPAVFIIDEINRAELSKVFGELMYALEYRGYKGKIKTQYSYLREKDNQSSYLKEEDKFFEENGEDYFFVPHNVIIIATMNTIDRSVDIFDFAMRRRFVWEKIEPDYDVIRNVLKESNVKNYADELANSLKKLNEIIKKEPLLGEDYQIGHSYVLNLKKRNKSFSSATDAKEYLWDRNLRPLLEEYLKGLADSDVIQKKLEDLKETWVG
jgi:5-methylcytosine-specific restriction protein B